MAAGDRKGYLTRLFPQRAMSALQESIVKVLRGVADLIHVFGQGLEQLSETKHDQQKSTQEKEREQTVKPLTVEFSDKQVTRDNAREAREYSIQKSIRNWARGAVIAAALYAAVTFLLWLDAHRYYILDQRPWLGSIATGVDVVPNAKPKISILIENFGKTPAMDGSYKALMDTPACGQFKPIWPEPSPRTLLAGIIFPTQQSTVNLERQFAIPGKIFDDSIRTGIYCVYAYVIVTYRDAENKRHMTEICVQYNATHGAASPCPEGYNNAN